ncbi:MAG: alpha/beta hydrolase [Hyphomicrobiaceae bacterium]
MTLCPGMAQFVAETDAIYAGLGGHETLAAQRAHYDDVYSARFRRTRPAGVTVEDRTVGVRQHNVPIRIYRPERARGLPPPPVVQYMHGGGWVLGSIASHDCITAEIAHATGAAVVSVDYRLAPEHPFPAAFEDCYGVMEFIAQSGTELGVDVGRFVVAGDSSGGNLAAALALAARNQAGVALAGQVLIYPVLSDGFEMPSHTENAHAPMLQTAEMRKFWRLYLGGADTTLSPYAAPLLAASFTQLPPAYIATAGYDPARDDGLAYAQGLRQVNVDAAYVCADDLAHGWLRARVMSPSAARAFDGVIAAIRAMVAGAERMHR